MSEEDTLNNVLREMLNLGQVPKRAQNGKKSWFSENVEFPHGTQFRATRKGKIHVAHIEDGELRYNGEFSAGFSPAAGKATGTNTNGWTFWHCKRPGDTDFVLVDTLRKK